MFYQNADYIYIYVFRYNLKISHRRHVDWQLPQVIYLEVLIDSWCPNPKTLLVPKLQNTPGAKTPKHSWCQTSKTLLVPRPQNIPGAKNPEHSWCQNPKHSWCQDPTTFLVPKPQNTPGAKTPLVSRPHNIPGAKIPNHSWCQNSKALPVPKPQTTYNYNSTTFLHNSSRYHVFPIPTIKYTQLGRRPTGRFTSANQVASGRSKLIGHRHVTIS
jgi:hypothetical protein